MISARTGVLIPALFVLALPAFAHAVLLSSTPAPDATVRGPDIPIRLRFNSRIDAARSRLFLFGPDGTQRALTLMPASSPDVLAAHEKGLTPGKWVLRWQVLASDGHITRGEVPFRVQ